MREAKKYPSVEAPPEGSFISVPITEAQGRWVQKRFYESRNKWVETTASRLYVPKDKWGKALRLVGSAYKQLRNIEGSKREAVTAKALFEKMARIDKQMKESRKMMAVAGWMKQGFAQWKKRPDSDVWTASAYGLQAHVMKIGYRFTWVVARDGESLASGEEVTLGDAQQAADEALEDFGA